jgi:hypothetical protein
MNFRIFLCVSAVLVPLVVGGCASSMIVKKVEAGKCPPKGLRYHLPQPYLVIYGNKNGEAVVEHLTLPDVTSEYAISTRTFMSKYKFGVSLDRGMLRNVEYSKDDTEVSKAIVEQILGTEGSPKDGGLLKEAMEADAANRSKGEMVTKDFYAKSTMTWGPVWYRIVDTGDCVSLEPVCFQVGCDAKNGDEKVFSQQREFQTIAIPAPKKAATSGGGGGDANPVGGDQPPKKTVDQIPVTQIPGGDAPL